MALGRASSVPMPPAIVDYWTMWNEPDVEAIRSHLDRAVAPDFVFSDPVHLHRGRDALEANVRALRTDRPRTRFMAGEDVPERFRVAPEPAYGRSSTGRLA